MARRLLCLALIPLLVAFSAPAEMGTNDPDVKKGISLVTDGEYDGAILLLDNAARRLATDKTKASDLSQAYLYLGVAYLGKGAEAAAKAKFREAIAQIKDLSLSPDDFPPKVIDAFEAAKAESAGAVKAPAPPKKHGSGKVLLIVGGVAAAGGIAAAAAGGSSGSSANTPSGTRQTLTFNGTLGYTESYTVVATKAGQLEARASWQNGQIRLDLSCQDQNPPYTDCGGTYTRTSNTTAVYTANVTQKEYLITIGNFEGYPEPQSYTLTVLFP